MAEPLIAFEAYGYQYRAQAEPTLADINLSIRAGEKILIVGPSGSGKSTLGRAINGLIPFNYKGRSTGRLLLDGRETKDLSLFEISKMVGTVLQDPDGQFVGLTAGEDIAFALENECVPQAEMLGRVADAAALVGMGRHLDAAPQDLSGGQKQRVSIAGVLVSRVRALLFDEPLANLDPKAGKHAIDLIDRLMRETDATVIVIEHRLEDALFRSADRVILMDNGRIVADMPPDEMLSLDLLARAGVREPLYVTALRYAGVSVTPAHRPGRAETLTLTDAEKARVRARFGAGQGASAPPEPQELLRAEDLRFAYSDAGAEAVRGISFAIGAGEMAAIVGENGAGKSTLAKLICGFVKPDAGRVLLRGRDLAEETIAERAAHIGYVMQNPNQMISKPMIFDEVALGLRSRGISEAQARERVEETLRVCGLHPFRKWPVSALSFGQKKRVTIASVLVMNPSVIILDEPTAGQDFRHYTEFMEFLRGLNSRGVTVLMITHDMHLMLEYARRALVFTAGKLLADTTPAALLCDATLTGAASLTETSLFHLAAMCGVGEDAAAFVQRFIDCDREARGHG